MAIHRKVRSPCSGWQHVAPWREPRGNANTFHRARVGTLLNSRVSQSTIPGGKVPVRRLITLACKVANSRQMHAEIASETIIVTISLIKFIAFVGIIDTFPRGGVHSMPRRQCDRGNMSFQDVQLDRDHRNHTFRPRSLSFTNSNISGVEKCLMNRRVRHPFRHPKTRFLNCAKMAILWPPIVECVVRTTIRNRGEKTHIFYHPKTRRFRAAADFCIWRDL